MRRVFFQSVAVFCTRMELRQGYRSGVYSLRAAEVRSRRKRTRANAILFELRDTGATQALRVLLEVWRFTTRWAQGRRFTDRVKFEPGG